MHQWQKEFNLQAFAESQGGKSQISRGWSIKKIKDNQQQFTAYMSFPPLEHRCIKSMKMPKPMEVLQNTARVTEQPLKELLELTHRKAKTREEFYCVPCFLPVFPALPSSALLTARENHSARRTNTFQHNQILTGAFTHTLTLEGQLTFWLFSCLPSSVFELLDTTGVFAP